MADAALPLIFAILVSMVSKTMATKEDCNFPMFMVRSEPWVGDYLHGDMVAYVSANHMTISEPQEGGSKVTYVRYCWKKGPDNKFLAKHDEDNQEPRYVCMQFLNRSEHVVQLKTSTLSKSMTMDLCDEEAMALDAFPLINYGGDPQDSGITCPFVGGYNINAYYHNKSDVCRNPSLLMRVESECDQGGGITINFREKRCIPNGLPLKPLMRTKCVAHWTQGAYTFIVLRMAGTSTANHYFCLRTSDPLSDITSAYLWLNVICDKSDIPNPQISTNFIHMEFTRRSFMSICEDEIEICNSMDHLCKDHTTRDKCSRHCGLCQSENQIGMCPFEEPYKGSWIDSATDRDVLVDVQTYRLTRGQSEAYDCIRLDEGVMRSKRVLVQLFNNGCLPRYACLEMEKVTSSVMRYRLGNRITWPLPSRKDQKQQVCKKENFRERYSKERPDRLLVNTEKLQEVPCNLPEGLEGGIAFNEDNSEVVCEGCLNYDRKTSPNYFIIKPTNCSVKSASELKDLPLRYSCLASFSFSNDSHSVVTKTASFRKGMGQYLVWIFTGQKQIQVMKAGETFHLERNVIPDSKQIQAQFSIQYSRKSECQRHPMILQPTSSTAYPRRPQPPPWLNGGNSSNPYVDHGHTPRDPGYEMINPGDKVGGKERERGDKDGPAKMGDPRNEAVVDGSKGENGVSSRHSAQSLNVLLFTSAVAAFFSSGVIGQVARTLSVRNSFKSR